jgi:hypothetical protein
VKIIIMIAAQDHHGLNSDNSNTHAHIRNLGAWICVRKIVSMTKFTLSAKPPSWFSVVFNSKEVVGAAYNY